MLVFSNRSGRWLRYEPGEDGKLGEGVYDPRIRGFLEGTEAKIRELYPGTTVKQEDVAGLGPAIVAWTPEELAKEKPPTLADEDTRRLIEAFRADAVGQGIAAQQQLTGCLMPALVLIAAIVAAAIYFS